MLPDGPDRAAFLAEHAAAIRVVVTSGGPGVNADTIAALPNLEAIVNDGAGTWTATCAPVLVTPVLRPVRR